MKMSKLDKLSLVFSILSIIITCFTVYQSVKACHYAEQARIASEQAMLARERMDMINDGLDPDKVDPDEYRRIVEEAVEWTMHKKDKMSADVYFERSANGRSAFFTMVYEGGLLRLVRKSGVPTEPNTRMYENIYEIMKIDIDRDGQSIRVHMIDPHFPTTEVIMTTAEIEKAIIGRYRPHSITPDDPKYITTKLRYLEIAAANSK